MIKFLAMMIQESRPALITMKPKLPKYCLHKAYGTPQATIIV